jgi:nuclear transport factor 2 (NTF2) superfamily protein
MKKTIFLLAALFLMTNCASDTSESSNGRNLLVSLVPSTTDVYVDHTFTVTVNAEEEIKQMWVSTNNFATGGYAFRNFGTSFVLNFNFQTLGEKTISVRVRNQDNVVSEKHLTINVTRGNTIKINRLQIVNFPGINTTFDPEYGPTDPNRLADLIFAFQKKMVGNRFDYEYDWRLWFRSSIIENQGNMTWELSEENLYLKPDSTVRFSLGEMNGEFGNELIDAPYYKEFNFNNYLTTKPNLMTFSYPEINLEFVVTVAWPD